ARISPQAAVAGQQDRAQIHPHGLLFWRSAPTDDGGGGAARAIVGDQLLGDRGAPPIPIRKIKVSIPRASARQLIRVSLLLESSCPVTKATARWVTAFHSHYIVA